VEGRKGVKGKTIKLDVTMNKGRIDDLLRLAVKAKEPLLVGAVSFKAKMELPPGDRDVVEKLKLDGQFQVADAKFTSWKVQDRLEGLSKRGQGKKTLDGDVASNFNGKFVLAEGVISFPGLSFRVPGAEVRLAGKYGLQQENLDFAGQLRLEAKASKAVGGWKSVLLKPIDPLLSKDGAGTVLAIRINGTREVPAYGVDMKKTLFR
jgi:hypothetical protein